ncbi:MAG TPA: hypothetical protein DDW50_01355 [Firmicutes bacterium]|jgi:hypothetical protein|nr:hypothetical protein [Bacillota bacterium]
MAVYQSFTGVITIIDNLRMGNGEKIGCNQLMSVENHEGRVINFVVQPSTYFVDQVLIRVGDMVTEFYDASAPTPYIFPPQLQAIVMAKAGGRNPNVKVDRFNRALVSSDGMLKLNISPVTLSILENGQLFGGDPAGRDLIVVYGPTTRSIPAQTTPFKMIVMC